MLEERVANEVVFVAIVPADEGDRQCPDWSRGYWATGFVGELTSGFIPRTLGAGENGSVLPQKSPSVLQ
jgi:hypothetical protein